jgi:hypothetical protein
MEDVLTTIQSPHYDKEQFKKQLDIITAASEEAQKRTDFKSAHDPEVVRAISIVEEFLRRSGRLCYGGQAINAHLPKKYQFYDPEHNVPDYDFFTPDQASDIELLSEMLLKAGFEEISSREGMHAGTKKLYVNFIPVADLTQIDERLYDLLHKEAYESNRIKYMGSDTLRMLMYLELSRPGGQVERWSKVYERLMLLNTYSPIKRCHTKLKKGLMTSKEVEDIMDFITHEKRVFAGGDLNGFYKQSFGKKRPYADWLLQTRQPILFFSPDLMNDTKHFAYELRHSSEERTYISKVEGAGGDLIPPMTIFMRRDEPILILVAETACHAYYDVPLKTEKKLRVATIDTLITLYFALNLLKYKFRSLGSLGCLAKELVEISFRARNNPLLFPFPFVSLKCSGHQKGMPSLIRSKVRRIRTEKLKLAKKRRATEKNRKD